VRAHARALSAQPTAPSIPASSHERILVTGDVRTGGAPTTRSFRHVACFVRAA
jgi:hypothetical protein